MTKHDVQSALRSPKSAHYLFPQLQLTTPAYALNIQHGNTRTVIPPQILMSPKPLEAPSLITAVAQKMSFKKRSQGSKQVIEHGMENEPHSHAPNSTIKMVCSSGIFYGFHERAAQQ